MRNAGAAENPDAPTRVREGLEESRAVAGRGDFLNSHREILISVAVRSLLGPHRNQ